MAIYHCSCKAVSRSAGRSSTAAAAYRSGEKITDNRTGDIHDYTRKNGVEYTEIFCPLGVTVERESLWNMAEAAEKRKDAKVAREWEVALPSELTKDQRQELAREFCKALVERYGIAVDLSMHEPNKNGDQRNFHAHILTTTRRITPDGLTTKTRELDDPRTGAKEIACVRETWAELANNALARAEKIVRIDERSLQAQGIKKRPSVHLGPSATAMERRGIQTERGDINREVVAFNKAARAAQIELYREMAGEAALKKQKTAEQEEKPKRTAFAPVMPHPQKDDDEEKKKKAERDEQEKHEREERKTAEEEAQTKRNEDFSQVLAKKRAEFREMLAGWKREKAEAARLEAEKLAREKTLERQRQERAKKVEAAKAAYQIHSADLERRGCTLPSELDFKVCVRLRVTGHDSDVVADIVERLGKSMNPDEQVKRAFGREGTEAITSASTALADYVKGLEKGERVTHPADVARRQEERSRSRSRGGFSR